MVLLYNHRMNDSLKILYIDDEPDLLAIASSFFEDAGLPIETCQDFDQALQRIRSRSYDLIISDSRMPGGSGTHGALGPGSSPGAGSVA